MQREYEVMFLIKPNLEDARYTELTEKFQTIIKSNEGEIVSFDAIGMKDLAQSFDKINRAYYIYSEFNATAKTLTQLKSFFNLTEDIMRNLIVLKESVTVHKKRKQLKKVES